NLVRPMVNKPSDEDEEQDLQAITRYINFQNKISEDFNVLESHNTTFVSENIPSDYRFKEIEDICSDFSIVSQISIVTTFNGKVNGCLSIHQASSRKWLMEEVDLIEIIAEHFSIAVDRPYAIDKIMIANHNPLKKTFQLKNSLKEEKRIREMQNEFVEIGRAHV